MHRLQSFFVGRNGPDALSKATSTLAIALLLVSMFLSGAASQILWMLALIFLVLSYFRILSKNLWKRQAENQKFLEKTEPIRRKFRQLRLRRQQRNVYAFFKCPQCGTVLRVPKGRGHVRITCKNCTHVFERNA